MTSKRSPVAEPVVSIEPAQKAWSYSLFDAIFQRRARRFPLGAEMPGGVAPFKSDKEPIPLEPASAASTCPTCRSTMRPAATGAATR